MKIAIPTKFINTYLSARQFVHHYHNNYGNDSVSKFYQVTCFCFKHQAKDVGLELMIPKLGSSAALTIRAPMPV